MLCLLLLVLLHSRLKGPEVLSHVSVCIHPLPRSGEPAPEARISNSFPCKIAVPTAAKPQVHIQQGDAISALQDINKPIRLIISDVDGTIVNRAGHLFEPNSAAFRLARLLGIQIAVATGRPRSSVQDILGEENMQKMGFSGSPGVYLNGSYVVGPDGKLLRDEPLKPAVLKRVLELCEEEGMLADAMGVTEGPLLRYADSSDVSKPVHKVHVEGDPEKIAKLRRRLQEELGDSIAFTQSHLRAFEVLTPGFDKGEGLRLLAASLSIPTDEVLALGNAENDISLFSAAGTSVAVGDAYAAAKDAADFITVPSEEGALFEVVLQLLRRRLALISQAAAPQGK
ncbi:hypothetical protein Efla_000735 [Eimeria flavescens]